MIGFLPCHLIGLQTPEVSKILTQRKFPDDKLTDESNELGLYECVGKKSKSFVVFGKCNRFACKS